MEDVHQITTLLRSWSDGDGQALDELFPLVYDELHRLACSFFRRERAGHTLQTTALIHEAYMRLVERTEDSWDCRAQFFAFAAKIMRNILVDHARSKRREKRGGDAIRISFTDLNAKVPETDIDLIALNEALDRLNGIDDRQVRIVELRYFAGLSLDETADMLKVSRATVARDWNVARAWLHRELTR